MKQLFSILLIVAVVVVTAMARGTATDENPPDRIPRYLLPFRHFSSRRGVPARFARERLRRGTEHRY